MIAECLRRPARAVMTAFVLAVAPCDGAVESYQVPFADGSGSYTIEFMDQADVMNQDVVAIVNAANPPFLGGGGIDGAIHSAAGDQLEAFNKQIEEVEHGVRCPTGSARISPAYDIAKEDTKKNRKGTIRYVIGTAGPDCRSTPYHGTSATSDAKATLASSCASALYAAAYVQNKQATSLFFANALREIPLLTPQYPTKGGRLQKALADMIRDLYDELEQNFKLLNTEEHFAGKPLPAIISIAYPIISGNIYACDFEKVIAPGMIEGITTTMEVLHRQKLPTPNRILICFYAPGAQTNSKFQSRLAQHELERYLNDPRHFLRTLHAQLSMLTQSGTKA